MIRMHFRIPLLFCCALLMFTRLEGVAQQASPAAPVFPPTISNEDRELIRQLLKRVEELEAEIREMKAEKARAVSDASTATNQTASNKTDAKKNDAAVQPDSPEDSAITSSQAETKRDGSLIGLPGMQIRGFSDVGFRTSRQKGDKNSFGIGQIDLFITSRLSEKLSVLSELVLEAGEDNSFVFEAERLLLQYSLNDYLNIGVGRYHTAIGFYNTAYHHGTWFQTATGRPMIFDFEDEGGILPIHNTGITINGRIPSGSLGLRYIAELGNGRTAHSVHAEPVQNTGDENSGKSINLALLARPDRFPGLQTGFSVYRDRLAPAGTARVGQTILAAHAVYQRPDFEFLNELVVVRHALEGSNRVYYTPGFYTQIAHRFRKVRPYFRYQALNAPESDPILHDAGRRHGPSFGLRYDFSDYAALKLQYDHLRQRRLSAINGLTLQFAFTF